MSDHMVLKIRSKKHLLASSARLSELNELRLTALLSPEEEVERKTLDLGINFYVLAKLRGRKGFASFKELMEFHQVLHLIFNDDYDEPSGGW